MRGSIRWVPDPYYKEVEKFSKKMQIPTSKGFLVRDRILYGDFNVKKRRKTNGVWVWELELGNF